MNSSRARTFPLSAAAQLPARSRWALAAIGLAIWQARPAPLRTTRSRGLSCTDCHTAAPRLNARGEEFLALGYRRSATGRAGTAGGFPISAWITGRHEDRSAGSLEKTYVPKVELISGGPLGEGTSSYFVEWRVVSLDVRGNGTLRDRGGRFEDAFRELGSRRGPRGAGGPVSRAEPV